MREKKILLLAIKVQLLIGREKNTWLIFEGSEHITRC